MSVLPSTAHAQIKDGSFSLEIGGQRVGNVFTTKHQTVGNTCTYTEYWYLFKGFKYLGSSSKATLTVTTSKTQYATADAFKTAMKAKGGRLAVATVVEEGACATTGISLNDNTGEEVQNGQDAPTQLKP